MNLKRYRLKDYDFKMIILVLALSIFGVFIISSAMGDAGASNVRKQIGGIIVGMLVMIIVSLVDYHFILKFRIPIYVLNVILLTLVLFFGKSVNNAQRWLPIGGIRFQPSELGKLMLILFFASFIMKYREKISSLHLFLLCCGLFVVPFFLIYKQPDLSTSLVLIFIFGAMIFSGGIKKRIILVVLLIAIPVCIGLVSFMLNPDNHVIKEYQLNRIYGFLYPEEYPNIAYQQNNSVTAIGSGMLDGKGYKIGRASCRERV